ncbi:kinase-like domain-containing protein [Chlamydoabsidia padenii]|nr:kinase-like domain-containing protein [Chlamydoabsidia padenii]
MVIETIDISQGGVQVIRASVKDVRTGEAVELDYVKQEKVGSGTFGTVYQAKLVQRNEVVAIKEVLQDNRYKNRELAILLTLDHPNVCVLRYYFYRHQSEEKVTKGPKKIGDKTSKMYLNLVMDYMPETLYSVCRKHVKSKQRQPMSSLIIKLYMYQLFRALAYTHTLGICHRDIKPQNLLLDPRTGILKLCDFGSAKPLDPRESNVAYICSRYYRAPELIFGATTYTTAVDIWSAGCVMGELVSSRPLFPGTSSIDQLVEIIKVLGTPTKQQIAKMNPNYATQRLPQIEAKPLSKVFPPSTSHEALDLMARLLEYDPSKRITAIEAMVHPFFDELRSSSTLTSTATSLASSPTSSSVDPLSSIASTPKTPIPNQDTYVAAHDSPYPWPALFDFTEEELMIRPDLKSKLLPSHLDQHC